MSPELLREVLEHEPLRLEGRHNLLFLAGIVLVIIGRGQGWGTAAATGRGACRKG